MRRAKTPPPVLVLAGSDPSGSAGLQLDLRVLAALGAHPMGIATALTVQAPSGVSAALPVSARAFRAQLERLLAEVEPAAVKAGMLHQAAHVRALADALEARPEIPFVLDPVFVSTSGATLLSRAGARALAERLLPRATVLTPNLSEAALLAGLPVVDVETMRRAAAALAAMGAEAVLVKGGHLPGDAVDVLFRAGRFRAWRNARAPRAPRGTGCALASAIAAGLAEGRGVEEAVQRARRFVQAAIAGAYTIDAAGAGPPVLRAEAPTARAAPRRYRRPRR